MQAYNESLLKSEDLSYDHHETMDALQHLKTTVSERMFLVQKELTAIAGYFLSYEEDQRQRKGTLLKKGLDFYVAILRFDGAQIMQAIEFEIEAVKEMTDSASDKKYEETNM